MSGTLEGAKRAQATMKRIYGEEGRILFFKRIGQKGGRNSTNGGFASDKIGEDGLTGRERARIAGKKGGRISRRGKAKNNKEEHND